eukprot:scaffold171991_cov43-Prasinocladus_malaysianus.AAC.1
MSRPARASSASLVGVVLIAVVFVVCVTPGQVRSLVICVGSLSLAITAQLYCYDLLGAGRDINLKRAARRGFAAFYTPDPMASNKQITNNLMLQLVQNMDCPVDRFHWWQLKDTKRTRT